MRNIDQWIPVRVLHWIEDFIIIAATIAIIIMTIVNVLCRYVLLHAVIWSDEFIGFGMLIIGLIGTATCVRDKLNTSLDGLMSKLPGKTQTIAYFYVNILVLVLLTYFTMAGFSFLSTVGNQKSAMLKWSMKFFYGLIPVSCILYIVETIINVIKDIVNHRCRFLTIEEQYGSEENES